MDSIRLFVKETISVKYGHFPHILSSFSYKSQKTYLKQWIKRASGAIESDVSPLSRMKLETSCEIGGV